MEEYNAFISYSSKDIFPLEVCDFLEEKGLKCWIAPRNITPGTPYARAIMQGIQNSDKILVFISTNSLKSDDVLNEIDNAHSLRKTIVPIFIEDVKLSPEFNYYLKRKQWIPVSDSLLKDILSLFSKNVRKPLDCPRIDRKYTISSQVELRNIFKKDIDNRKLFSDIIIGFEPSEDFDNKLDFISMVPGGNLPLEYIAAVKQGLERGINLINAKGLVLSGIKAILYDGSFNCESDICAFEIVAENALNKALSKVGIRILEPMMRIEIEGDSGDEMFINNFVNRYDGEIFNYLNANKRYEVHALMPNNKIIEHYEELIIGNITINACTFAKYNKGACQQYKS